jgi:hypothetical protein
MPSTLPILRSRRERRLEKQRASSNRFRGVMLSAGMLLSLILGVVIILGAFAYADITRDLPSIEILPRLSQRLAASVYLFTYQHSSTLHSH